MHGCALTAECYFKSLLSTGKWPIKVSIYRGVLVTRQNKSKPELLGFCLTCKSTPALCQGSLDRQRAISRGLGRMYLAKTSAPAAPGNRTVQYSSMNAGQSDGQWRWISQRSGCAEVAQLWSQHALVIQQWDRTDVFIFHKKVWNKTRDRNFVIANYSVMR